MTKEELEIELNSLEFIRNFEKNAINVRLDKIEEIILAHQSWVVMQNGERECHKSVRNLIQSIRNIIK